jgi:membrane protease YdiL (CAAX protease family)
MAGKWGKRDTSGDISLRTNDESRPCFGELIAIVLAGGLHIAAEVTMSTTAARVFNLGVASAFLIYIIWRACSARHVLRIWGMQLTNFWPALKLQLVFAIPAMAFLIAFGIYSNSFPPPRTFWLAVILYPVWGIAQQFALQNLLARNLQTLVRPRMVRALLAAGLFGLAHVPLIPIVVLTFVGGFFLTWIYENRPNLWAAGCIHGVLGAMAFYFVLGKDPGARLWEYLFG